MLEFEWPEHLSIFFDNLCIYHVCFDLLSFFTVIFTWWYCHSSSIGSADKASEPEQKVTFSSPKEKEEEMRLENARMQEEETGLDWSDDNIMSNVRFMRQKALVRELKSKLTEDELEEERKTERMQLQKIFQLLQEQEDKFQMSSMEQLEDQLHLYIN